MTSIYQEVNVSAVETALFDPVIETRVAVNIRPDTTTYRFVHDTIPQALGADTWEPVPFANFGALQLGSGATADTITITLDGREMITPTSDTPDTILQQIINEDLRDRPVQIGVMVLDINTKAAIGLKPELVGFVDSTRLMRTDEGSIVEITCASLRAYSQRRSARIYSDTDHRTRFPGDGGLGALSDVIFRKAKYSWNSETAQGSATGGGGNPSYTPSYYDNINRF